MTGLAKGDLLIQVTAQGMKNYFFKSLPQGKVK